MIEPTLNLRTLPKLRWTESVPPTDVDLEQCVVVWDVPHLFYHTERRVFFLLQYHNAVTRAWYYANPAHDLVEG